MSKEWIKESGRCAGGEVDKVLSAIDMNSREETYYIALYTDRFESGLVADKRNFSDEFLLELRIFNADREILFSRSCISEEYCWRYITAESGHNDWNHFERYHVIDMNEDETGEENGILRILSTVGGRYELPISKDKRRVKVVTYVDYDANGMACTADHRICGFERWGAEK